MKNIAHNVWLFCMLSFSLRTTCGLFNCHACSYFHCIQCVNKYCSVMEFGSFIAYNVWINIAKKRRLDHPKIFRHYQCWHFVSNDNTCAPKNENVKKIPHMWDTESLGVSKWYHIISVVPPSRHAKTQFFYTNMVWAQNILPKKVRKLRQI